MNLSDFFKQLEDVAALSDIIICMAGLILFGVWLLRTSFGRMALATAKYRRNNMPVYVPFIPFFIWFGGVVSCMAIVAFFEKGLQEWQVAFWNNLALCVCGICAIISIVLLVRKHFTRGLKGFGFNVRTIGKDLWAAFVNLLSVWPLVLLAIILTMYFGGLIKGPDFQIERHEELKLIRTYTQLSVRILIMVTSIIIAPVLEEMLFRGLFQTMIRSFLLKAWPSIFISSALFALVHANGEHWPALFVLALCLGYSYEKSGSLIRPIFIHSIFNAISVTAVLNQ